MCRSPGKATNCAARSINTDVECGSATVDRRCRFPQRDFLPKPSINTCAAACSRLCHVQYAMHATCDATRDVTYSGCGRVGRGHVPLLAVARAGRCPRHRCVWLCWWKARRPVGCGLLVPFSRAFFLLLGTRRPFGCGLLVTRFFFPRGSPACPMRTTDPFSCLS